MIVHEDFTGGGVPYIVEYPIPKKIVAGTRVAMRTADDQAAGRTGKCTLSLYQDLE